MQEKKTYKSLGVEFTCFSNHVAILTYVTMTHQTVKFHYQTLLGLHMDGHTQS